MNALPSITYCDPSKWYEWLESRTCKGCVWEIKLWRGQGEKVACTKGKPHGKRCKQYQEGETHGDCKTR